MATAVLPSFLTSTLHAGAGALGLIEGVSDALMGVAKLLVGPLADDPRWRRRLASGGYLGTAAATGAIGLTTAVWQAGALRALAWISRGGRSPARDTLLASLAEEGSYGRAFGFERAGDNLGAVSGPLLAAGLVVWLGLRPTFYLAAVPGALAAFAITVAVRESRSGGAVEHAATAEHGGAAEQQPGPDRSRVIIDLKALRGSGLVRPLVPVTCFELGNMATTILILRATQLLHHGGRSLTAATSMAVLIYAGYNAAASVTSLAAGHWIDRRGPRPAFLGGAVTFAAGYGLLAAGTRSWPVLLLAFGLAGTGIGLAETSESVLVARSLPDRMRGSGFGLLGGVQAFGDFASTVTVGILYAAVSPAAGFTYAASWMVFCVLASLALGRSPGRLRSA